MKSSPLPHSASRPLYTYTQTYYPSTLIPLPTVYARHAHVHTTVAYSSTVCFYVRKTCRAHTLSLYLNSHRHGMACLATPLSTTDPPSHYDTLSCKESYCAHTRQIRESIEVRESTRVVLGDIPKQEVVRCSPDSCLLLSSFSGQIPALKLTSLNADLY